MFPYSSMYWMYHHTVEKCTWIRTRDAIIVKDTLGPFKLKAFGGQESRRGYGEGDGGDFQYTHVDKNLIF